MNKGQLAGKRVLVTAGATREYIDDVRILTNISTGKLGAVIADEFMQQYGPGFSYKHEVTYLHGRGAVLPQHHSVHGINIRQITGVSELKDVMQELVPEHDVADVWRQGL